MASMKVLASILLSFLVIGNRFSLGDGADVEHLSRTLDVVNDSGRRLEVDWVNPYSGEAVLFWSGEDGQRMSVKSYVNHTFLFRYAINGSNEKSQCAAGMESGECKKETIYTIAEDMQTQTVVVSEGLEYRVEEISSSTTNDPSYSDFTSLCRSAAEKALALKKSPAKVMAGLVKCLEDKTTDVLMKWNEELAIQTDLRLKISSLAENYTCADPTMETTPPVKERHWIHDGVTRNVGILHDRPSSQIHILHDFISREECDAIEAAAKPSLHRGTVADGKGGSQLSDNRKAWQAAIHVNWDKEKDGDPIAAVSRRLFDYANYAVGYNMTVVGQEDLMSIQYFGQGADDPTPDRYTPHCDGECDGRDHKTGARVATMVMYCDVPELGGGTNFQNSNVFVRPKAGAAAFFSYLDPKTLKHESGFTSHSGCPVLEGTKRIAVQWMRLGVDKENPWDSFDTNTVKKSLSKADDHLYTEDESEEAEEVYSDSDDEEDEEMEDSLDQLHKSRYETGFVDGPPGRYNV